MDSKELAAEFAVAFTKELAKDAAGATKKKLGPAQNMLRVGFEKYLNEIYSRCSFTKTLLHGSSPVPLDKIYIDCEMNLDKETISETEFVDNLISKSSKFIVSGTAGSGKSLLMNSLFIKTIKYQSKKLPIFLELRKLNKIGRDKLNLVEFMLSEFPKESKFNNHRFLDALNRGLFIFVFDGLDEISRDIQDKLENQIRNLISMHPKNSLVISSRPDESLYSWHQCELLDMAPLSKKKVVELINLVEFDQELKESFIKDVESSLYDKHRSFLCVPLLASMMLMTYQQFATIPRKIHVFYGQVYEVLFSRHDVRKDGKFIRDFYTDLPMDDFSSMFQAFSAISYFNKDYGFTNSQALSYVDKAKTVTTFEVNKSDYLEDLIKSVCLLVHDGLEIVFSHRSFQEYFTALFIAKSRSLNIEEAFKALSSRLKTDNVFSMLFGIDQDFVEMNYVIPKIDRLIAEVEKEKNQTNKRDVFAKLLFEKSQVILSSEIDIDRFLSSESDDFVGGIMDSDTYMRWNDTEFNLLIRLLFLWYAEYFEGVKSSREQLDMYLFVSPFFGPKKIEIWDKGGPNVLNFDQWYAEKENFGTEWVKIMDYVILTLPKLYADLQAKHLKKARDINAVFKLN